MDKFLFFYCRCKTSPAALQFAINLCYNKLIMHREPAVTRRLAAGPDLSGRDRLRCLPHCGACISHTMPPHRCRCGAKGSCSMIKIAPSILSADFAYLARDIEKISTADYVHVDVMDGVFVPNISIGIPVLKSIRKVTDMFLDVHLMITKPVRYVEEFCDAGADLVTVHVEADFPENIQAAIDKIHAKGKKAGIVLKPKTTWEAVLPYIDQVELILVMTVEPGFGGQKFMADQMPKVAAIRKLINERNPACELEVDGGVAPDTCQTCIDAGANVLVAGSAVYKAEDIPARIKELRGK